jgi:hypothetical protein
LETWTSPLLVVATNGPVSCYEERGPRRVSSVSTIVNLAYAVGLPRLLQICYRVSLNLYGAHSVSPLDPCTRACLLLGRPARRRLGGLLHPIGSPARASRSPLLPLRAFRLGGILVTSVCCAGNPSSLVCGALAFTYCSALHRLPARSVRRLIVALCIRGILRFLGQCCLLCHPLGCVSLT